MTQNVSVGVSEEISISVTTVEDPQRELDKKNMALYFQGRLAYSTSDSRHPIGIYDSFGVVQEFSRHNSKV